MIYIDPPYNTGNDFIYPDNYADPLDTYLRLTGQKDIEGNLLTTNRSFVIFSITFLMRPFPISAIVFSFFQILGEVPGVGS
jgi:hypothetical protein